MDRRYSRPSCRSQPARGIAGDAGAPRPRHQLRRCGHARPLPTTSPCTSGATLLTPPGPGGPTAADCSGRLARVRKYVIMGVQGSGKGTQAGTARRRPRPRPPQRRRHLPLARPAPHQDRRPGAPHDGRRRARRRRPRRGVVRDRLAMHDWNYGFVLDGFPRNVRQAEFFLESYDIDGVINLEHARRGRARAGAGAAAVLGMRARLEPARPPPEGARRLRHLRGAARRRGRTTPRRRWRPGCATTTPRRRRSSRCSSARSSSPRSTRRSRSRRSRPRSGPVRPAAARRLT